MKPPNRKRRKLVFTKVVAHLPHTVELTNLKSENGMTIEIRSGDTLARHAHSWAVVACSGAQRQPRECGAQDLEAVR
jgi:hypothetical protein